MPVSRNKNFGKAPQEAKKLVIENLPLPVAIVLGLFLIIVYVLPFVLRYFFPTFQYVEITITIILIIYALTLVIIISNKYYKKTGTPIAKELNRIQNEQKFVMFNIS